MSDDILMNIYHQNRPCHSERSEASRLPQTDAERSEAWQLTSALDR